MPVYLAAGGSFLVYLAMMFFVSKWLNLSGTAFYIFFGLTSALGLTGAALWIYFKTKWKGGSGGAGGPITQDAAIDQIVREADQRLASQNVTIANLPLVFVVGDRGSTKTSAMVYSGVEPELLAGATFGEGNMIVPTQHANIWFARGTAFVEAAGSVFADPQKWLSLVRRLKPASLKSLVGKGQQAPRGVLLCFDIETFAKPGGAEAVTAAARYIQARFAEISQVLGINFPVYVLFTRTDRIQFFADYVRHFSNEEATQVFGSTLSIRDHTQGVYAEEEMRRLSDAFNSLFFSLCDKRTVFLPREGDSTKTPQPYEFPRELAKLRGSIVNFLVEVCRPSQLRASPFLRGFYFAGVRPITVSDAAPVSMRADGGEEALRGAGAATQMFRMGKLQEDMQKQAQAKAQGAGRRVPQWMFLGHLFNGILLRDTSALGASGSSTKTSFLQRVLLATAAGLLLLFSIGLLVSFFSNQGLENQGIAAAKGLAPTADLQGCALPSLDQLQKLDSLRQSLAQLSEYQDNGAPLRYRLGLYAGNELLPEVRTAYYDRFRALLFGQTQKGLVNFMQKVPDDPSPQDDYGTAYDSVKSYLLTAKESGRTSDKALASFLGSTLHQRWSTCKTQEIPKEVSDLAKTQFAFYASDLPHGNPYSSENDRSVPKAQKYLAKFGGVKAAYMALLAKADREKPAQTYNERFDNTAYAEVSRTLVRYAFTKPGYDFMVTKIKNANAGDEPWVLGEYAGSKVPKEELEGGIRDLYATDYIDTWRKVLRDAAFTGYSGLPDAETKLQKIIGSPQPILCLLWWAASSTNVDLGKVRQSFAAVHFVQPPSDTQACIVDKNRAYNDALARLQEAVARANAPGVDPVQKASMINDQKNSATNATKSIASGPVDSEGQMDTVVANLMLKPIIGVPAPDPGAGANAAGGAFCVGFNGLKNKFPFKQVEPEVSLAELSDIFKPQTGKLWQFYEGTGKTFVTCSAAGCAAAPSPPLPVNPAFVTSFSSLVRFSKALYGDSGTDPNYKFSLKPKSDFYDTYVITVNGDKSTVKAGSSSKTYSWPGPGSPSFALEIVQKGNTNGIEVQRFSTLWSVFRFFANAEKTDGTNFTFFNRSGRDLQPAKIDGKIASYDFSLDTQGAPAVFSKDFLASLNCVGRVTAPK
jgi:type VI secretion system protein ImpL